MSLAIVAVTALLIGRLAIYTLTTRPPRKNRPARARLEVLREEDGFRGATAAFLFSDGRGTCIYVP